MLYAPPAYAAADPLAIVRHYPFALLVTWSEGELLATSTPMFFETDESNEVLIGHLARRNNHASALQAGQRALAIFSGPHAYVSSSWYVEKPTVPTWNYVVAHVRGTIQPIDDGESHLRILRRTASVLEQENSAPWTLEQAPAGTVERLLPHIRSFRLLVEKVEGVTKLSQTHPPGDRLRIIRHLLERHDDGSTQIARLMAQLE